MHCMRILLAWCVLVCSMLLAGAALAQEVPVVAPAGTAPVAEEAKKDGRPNSLYPGSWSLQFQITEDIGLKPFNGMIVSMKRHFSERSALRLGVRFDLDWNDTETSHLMQVSDTTYDWAEASENSDYQKFTIDLSYLRYVRPGSYVNFFWGAGPLVGYSRSSDTDEMDYPYGNYRKTDSYSRSWSVGALGLVGVEWFLVKHFSFHAEYRASFSYVESVMEQDRTETGSSGTRHYHEKDEGARLDFQSVYVVLGLSVYF